MKQYIIIIIAALCTLISCKQAEEPSLKLSSNALSVSSSGDILTVVVTTNNNWTASTSAGWLQLDKKNGPSGSTSLYITVSKSNEDSERTADVVVTSSTKSEKVTITQSQATVISLSKKEIFLGHEAGQFKITVTHNVDVEVGIESSVKWLSMIGSKSSTTNECTFAYTANEGSATRQTEVIFKDKNSSAYETLKVIQKIPMVSYLKYSIYPPTLSKQFKAPLITPANTAGTIDWGDNVTAAYSSSATHSYQSKGTYEVIVTTTDSQTVEFSELYGIFSINLSQF